MEAGLASLAGHSSTQTPSLGDPSSEAKEAAQESGRTPSAVRGRGAAGPRSGLAPKGQRPGPGIPQGSSPEGAGAATRAARRVAPEAEHREAAKAFAESPSGAAARPSPEGPAKENERDAVVAQAQQASLEAWKQSARAGPLDAVLQAVPELGLVSVGPHGTLVRVVPPIRTVGWVLPTRWRVTVSYLAGPAELAPGDYFVCVYDGWREYSAYTPENAGRMYVPFMPAMVARYSGIGSAGEPRFMHDPAAPEVYPVLPAPVIAYSRHVGDRCVRLIPDSEFLSDTHLPTLRQVVMADLPFSEKTGGRVFWRGSAHNHATPDRMPPRAELMQTVMRSPAVGRVVDAQYTDASCRASIADQLRYRYLLDLDGAVNAWCGLFWKLASRSVVMRLPTPWEQWYYPSLKAGTHYIPVAGPEQLPRALQWAEAHPTECQAMAQAATELVADVLEAYQRTLCEASVRDMRRFLGPLGVRATTTVSQR